MFSHGNYTNIDENNIHGILQQFYIQEQVNLLSDFSMLPNEKKHA